MRLYIFKNNTVYLFIILSILLFIGIYYYKSLENFQGGNWRKKYLQRCAGDGCGLLYAIPSRVIYIVLGLFGGAVILGVLMQYFSPTKTIKNFENIGEKSLNKNIVKKNLTPIKAVTTA